MRRRMLTRRQWLAVVVTAAGMLGLLVYLTQVSLSEAVAVSTVLSLFVAVAALLVAVLSVMAPRDDAGSAKTVTEPGTAVTQPGSRGPANRQITLPPLEPLTGAIALLGIALCTFASDSLLRYLASWPWWVAAATAFLGFVAASSGLGADLKFAVILIFNMLWFFTYSVIIVEYRQTSSPFGQLATLSWVGAASNTLFLITLVASNIRRKRAARSWQGRQPILVVCLAFGMGLTAIALRGRSDTSWNVAGWVFIAALVADLALLSRAPRSRSTA
jgi:hypothetical protein